MDAVEYPLQGKHMSIGAVAAGGAPVMRNAQPTMSTPERENDHDSDDRQGAVQAAAAPGTGSLFDRTV